MFSLDSNSIQIMSSRDSIRKDLIDYAKTYLELENVDLYYTSFVSYIINVLSILAANQMYYTSTVYREFFLTEAQMQESVYNLATWIGYTIPAAIPASADVMFTIPLTFKENNVLFEIPPDFKIKADEITYSILNQLSFTAVQTLINEAYNAMPASTYISVMNNSGVTVRNQLGYYYPVVINRTQKTASFIIPFSQFEVKDTITSVPQNLEIYQFWSKKVEGYTGMPGEVIIIDGVAKSADVWEYPAAATDDDIINGNASGGERILQAEANSLYTMDATQKRYVMLIGNNKCEFFFGNGIIGKQPTPGNKIYIKLCITRGEEGRVIANSLINPDKLYYTYTDTLGTKSLPIRLTTTNLSPAIGGQDIPSISTIKARAIANLRSKGRLVSSGDYDEITSIIPNTPLADALPVLKRSDLKVNEIELFSRLVYGGTICPTRNLTMEVVDSTGVIIPDHIIITKSEPTNENPLNTTDYETFFEMRPEFDYANVRYYYNVSNLTSSVALKNYSQQYARLCYIIATTANFTVSGDSLKVILDVTNTPGGVTNFSCLLNADWFETEVAMTPDFDTSSKLVSFTAESLSFKDVPENIQTFNFSISGVVNDTTSVVPISTWYCNLTLKKNLDNFMLSSMTYDSTADLYTIHNIPTIKSSYFEETASDAGMTEDDFRNQFELTVIQRLINNVEINSKRMLTDFINIKFTDSIGKLTNMKYNRRDITIISDSLNDIPAIPSKGDVYIVSGYEDPTNLVWGVSKINKIATYTGSEWQFRTPVINQTAWISDIGKIKVWSGSVWFDPTIFDIPLKIEAVVEKSPTSVLPPETIGDNVKNALISYFSSKFGIDSSLDRSEIIKVIRSVDGVTYCNLIKPEIDILFDYTIPADLDQVDLLDYTPQMVQFEKDTISIAVTDTTI